MAFRWRKSLSLGRFARINVTKNGVGFSLGPRSGPLRFNVSPKGQKSVGASIPGTGLSYNEKIGDRPQQQTDGPSNAERQLAAPPSAEVAAGLSRNGVRAALEAAGFRLASDEEPGFGVREPDEAGAVRAFWVNGQQSQREEQVPNAAAALRKAGYNARVIRLDGGYPGILIKPAK